ncbi:MAG TPA: 16S rRNA (guanine(527)-N(7))-methyltransferase RsmG [Blastocatellia bacterium]|nr:16S rRNA (guanine(527)-N(7))-methyltransferase RsmG [Blastocatellia bacterium]
MSKQSTNGFKPALEEVVSSFGLDALTEQQLDQCALHYDLLCRWNPRVNLTRITEPREAARFHYAESFFGAQFIENERTVLDIGSGAGFPAIPLAIVRPDLEVTALEANQKKSLFLKEARDELRLANLWIATARLEEFDWTGYQLLTSRALEKAETVFQSVIESMAGPQRLMLYCAADLAAKLEQHLPSEWVITMYPIPQTESRIIAIFSFIPTDI